MKGNLILNARSVFRGDIIFEEDARIGYHKKTDDADIQVCLNCTKPNCCGEVKCFRKRKKEMKKEASG